MFLAKKTISVAISSALSFMALSTQPVHATDYDKIELSSANGESTILNNVHVDTGISQSPAVIVNGPLNELQGNDYEIKSNTIGVLVENSGKANLSDLVINAGQMGALSVGAESSLTLDNASIVTSNDQSVGVKTLSGSLNFSNGSIHSMGDSIIVDGTYQTPNGLVIRDSEITSQNGMGVAVNANNATLDLDSMRINTLGAFGSAIFISDNNATVNLKNSVLNTQDRQAEAVSNNGGEFNMDGGAIFTRGSSSHALSVNKSGAHSNINNVLIETFGPGAAGAMVRVPGGEIRLTDSHIITHGDLGLGMYAAGLDSSVQLINSDILTFGKRATAVTIRGNASARLENATIITTSEDAYGIDCFANAAGVVSSVAISNSTIKTQDGAGIRVAGGGMDAHVTDSTLIGRDNGGPGTLLSVTNTAHPADQVNLQAVRSQLQGDIIMEGGSLQLSLADHSTLEGAIKVGRQDIQLTIDNTSSWKVRGDSVLSRLSNEGVVQFASPATAGAFKQLHMTGDLSGNGFFIMNSDLSTLQGDNIRVDGETLGNHTLVVADSGYGPEDAEGRLTLVSGNGGSGTFDLMGGHVDAGAFRYMLSKSGLDWVLASSTSLKPDNLSKGANAAVATQTARAALWSAETDTLVKRLGDLRLGHDQGGLWMRNMDSRYKFNTGTSRTFDQNIHGLQIGADKAVGIDSGKVYLGGFVGMGESRQSFGEGAKGQIDSKSVGLYATYLNDNGIYVDTLAKFSSYDTNTKISNKFGGKAKGSFDSNAYGVSAEVGKRITFDSGWFVEPQVQLSFGRLQGGRYTSTNGLRVKADAIDTLQSRVGGLVGNTIKLNNGMAVQPYIKASWLTEHRGNSEVRVNKVKLSAELPGDRGEVGLGTIFQIANQHRISLDAEYAKGNGIEQPWAVNLGYRFAM